MKTLCIIAFLLMVIACSSNDATENECEQITTNQDSGRFELISHIVFDTSANLFHATIVDYTTSVPIVNAKILFDQNQLNKEVLTDQTGEAEIFENGFSGFWQLTISHDDYRCLIIQDVEIEGGRYATIKLKPI